MENEDAQMSTSSDATPVSSPQKTTIISTNSSKSFDNQLSSETPNTPPSNLQMESDNTSNSHQPPLTPITPLVNNSQQDELPVLNSFIGTLESMYRTATRQKKWILITLLPGHDAFTSTTQDINTRVSRPAWGPGAYHQQQKLNAPQEIIDNVLLWRRSPPSSDADRYTAFYPVDGLPHIALLDPRSGERLCVWGNVDGEGMEAYNVLDVPFWETIVKDLLEFLKNHSLEDGHLGPTHQQEKPWSVRTRRVTDSKGDVNLPPTSMMDDEEAAIAAAIAASLAEATGQDEVDEEDIATSNDGNHSDEMYSEDDSDERDDDDSSDENDDQTMENDDIRPTSDTTTNDEDNSTTPSVGSPNDRRIAIQENASSRHPIAIPTMTPMIGPSSVESLSSSYIERMESCFRSSVDPELMEVRRLRQEQDAELAASLEADKRRAKIEEDEAASLAQKEDMQKAAERRLVEEPKEKDPKSITIAIRLGNGSRIMRRFHSSHRLLNVADFIIAKTGFCEITNKVPSLALRTPGGSVNAMNWDTYLQDMDLCSRTMFILDQN